MGFTKSDLRLVFIGMKILEDVLPDPDEVDEIIDKCMSTMELDELHDVEAEIEALKSSDEMMQFARDILE